MVIDFDEKEKFVSQRKQCLLAKLQNHMLHHISLGLSALSAQRPFVTPCSSRLAILMLSGREVQVVVMSLP
ncbi:MAG: hypothetical protein EBX72_06145 [Betaproteobacteria bacterium]|nr:hypothetical protein [Betaproteobacteria bacterium]